jgi:hypothetical protein
MNQTIVVAGALAQKPKRGGHTWALLQYLLGFRQLGWNVLFLDRFEPERCVDERRQPCPPERSVHVRYFLDVMEQFDLQSCFALLEAGSNRSIGIAREEVLRRTSNSVLFLNIMGFLTDEAVMHSAPRRVFLDIDPGFPQMWHALGLADLFVGYHDYVTIAENIGKPGCTIPTRGLDWITTRPPVVLDYWPIGISKSGAFTTVASWRGAYGPVEYEGKTYGLRAHEFRKFAELPRHSNMRFELALDINPQETKDLSLLRANGWHLLDPQVIARDPSAYRSFISGSCGEFMVAKSMYVENRGGWFSDRSICYLASGKPVLAQDTGLRDNYPTGRGLVVYSNMEEAVEGLGQVAMDYDWHARGARRLAEEYFDSRTVLPRLLDRLGIRAQ